MAKDASPGNWGQPKYSTTEPPELGVDETQLSDYYAPMVPRRFTTLALALAAVPPGNGYSATGDNAPGALLVRVSGAWVMHGTARFASQAARASAITAPADGMLAYIGDRDWTEQYFAADTTGAPDLPAGWYPVSGRMPQYRATFTKSVVTATQNEFTTFTESHDPFGLFTTSGTTVVLPSIAGRYLISSFMAWPSNNTGARGHFVTVDSTTGVTAKLADQKPAAYESWSSIARVHELVGGNTIRVAGYQESGGALTVSGELEIHYLGPI